ncbi:MAG: methyltransferase domain-containing protein [Clostridia bacterium]|nr:methyltransferase domain-containing protein [Clostridia bacterium]
MNAVFICPVCKKPLNKDNGSLTCGKHVFDIARKGYVNLLTSNQKKTKSPGDNKVMIAARKTALESGYYSSLYAALKEIVKPLYPKTLLDLGCGEGSLTDVLADFAETTIGLDVSKDAIAAASGKKGVYAVASAASIPLPDESVDVLINCFAPLYQDAERVLKKEGLLIKVTPAKEHLYELKEAVYPEPYYNPPDKEIPRFKAVNSKIVTSTVVLSGELLKSVITMTPYFYKTPKELIENVLDKEIPTTLAFSIRVMKKEE